MNIHGLTDDQVLQIVKSIRLHLPETKIFAFGSRVKGEPRQYSDLDIALDAGSPIDLAVLGKIKNTLAQTDLPIVVDIVDYLSIASDFKAIIDSHKVELK